MAFEKGLDRKGKASHKKGQDEGLSRQRKLQLLWLWHRKKFVRKKRIK